MKSSVSWACGYRAGVDADVVPVCLGDSLTDVWTGTEFWVAG